MPAGNLIGKLNDGWRIANALLGHERIGTSNPQFALIALEAQDHGARLRESWPTGVPGSSRGASINVTAMAALFSHGRGVDEPGAKPWTESSIIKIFGSELLQSLNELLIEAAGGHAPTEHPIATEFGEVEVATPTSRCGARTIYGGSSEIQRNVVARPRLNLPN